MDECLEDAIYEVNESKKYLQSIQMQFMDDPELLNIYEPSAKEMVTSCENHLLGLLKEQTDMDLARRSNMEEIDVWVRLEGDSFHDGHGPIGVVGNFLQKLSKATQHITGLVERTDYNFSSSFDLVQTAAGSLKIGLRRTATPCDDCLFPSEWDRLRECASQHDAAVKGIQTLMEIMDKVNQSDNVNALNSISEDEMEVYKLLYYAKEVTPSSRSPIERISFEINNPSFVKENKGTITADKQTRKNFVSFTKELGKHIEHVKASGVIRAIDIDERTFVIRDLISSQFDISEIETKFPKYIPTEELSGLLDKKVRFTGFLKTGPSGRMSGFDVEVLTSVNEDNNEEVE